MYSSIFSGSMWPEFSSTMCCCPWKYLSRWVSSRSTVLPPRLSTMSLTSASCTSPYKIPAGSTRSRGPAAHRPMQPVWRTWQRLPDLATSSVRASFSLSLCWDMHPRAMHTFTWWSKFSRSAPFASEICRSSSLVICSPTFQLLEQLRRLYQADQFAVFQNHGSASACAHATCGHQRDVAIRGGLAWFDLEVLLRLCQHLIRTLDVAGGADADRAGVLARRLQTEVMVEGHYPIGLAKRHMQRQCDEPYGGVVQIAKRGLSGVECLDQGVAGITMAPHRPVYDLPPRIIGRKWGHRVG